MLEVRGQIMEIVELQNKAFRVWVLGAIDSSAW